MLPCGKQTIEADDIQAVLNTLESDWLTTGPMVDRFESSFAQAVGAQHAVAVSSGTAALHTAVVAAKVGPGDEVIVPAISFVATANAVMYSGGTPVFADICLDTLLIDPVDVAEKITGNTKAIVAMDYAGQPCDYRVLREIADRHGLVLIADACHALGGAENGTPVGDLADLNCFSLHPVKPITAGEGGVITTNDSEAAEFARTFRNHGITTDFRTRAQAGTHAYKMTNLGFNYRLTDIQCALAESQLKKLARFTNARNDVARMYDQQLAQLAYVTPLTNRESVRHAYHLYVVHWDTTASGRSRDEAFRRLREEGIGVNVHYEPIYRHPFYQERFDGCDHRCPNAERAYADILSLPMFPSMTAADVGRVVRAISQVSKEPQRGGIRSVAW